MTKRRGESRGYKVDPSTGLSYVKGSYIDEVKERERLSLQGPPKTGGRREIPEYGGHTKLTNQEIYIRRLALLLVLITTGLYFAWQWMKSHVWQSVLGGVVVGGSFILALWKSPQFRTFMMGDFWRRLGDFQRRLSDSLKPPPGTERDRGMVPPLTQTEKNILFDKVGNRCEYCEDIYTLDIHHINPRAEGGSNKHSNLIVLCAKCHRMASGGGISRARLEGIARSR